MELLNNFNLDINDMMGQGTTSKKIGDISELEIYLKPLTLDSQVGVIP